MDSRKTFFSILFFILATNLSAQYYYLNIQDPQRTWYSSKGTIEEAVISVGPKGLYSQISMYLTFSARGGSFVDGSQLEAVLNFDLPEGSFVTDLWLWIGNKISKGKVLDYWSASSIYEGIVQRRRDPAILSRKGNKSYELRVYPLEKSGTRKVRITYLVPNTWTETSVTTPLPNQILSASLNKVNSFSLVTWSNLEWTNPVVDNYNGSFAQYSDSFFNDHLKMNIDNPSTSIPYYLTYKSPMVNGLYFKYFKTNNDGYYQLSVLPSISQSATEKKVLFLIDYDSRKSNTTRSQVLDGIRQTLFNNVAVNSSFNILYSGLTIGKLSGDWIEANPLNINSAFQSINENSISSYSNLTALLKEGYDFLIKKGGGVVCLISNSDQLGSNANANALINDLRNVLTINLPTYILDYNDKDFTYYYFNNRSYLGNEYFYDNLSKLTGGSYQRISGTFNNSLLDLYSKIGGTINSFDLYTTLENGFSFSRQNLSNNGSVVSIRRPITQIGKFIGQFPFIIKTSGVYNSVPFTQSMSIVENSDKLGEPVTEKMWVNSYITSIDVPPVTNSVINEIVGLGIRYGILSRYNAFLALEDTTSFCSTCYYDDGKPIGPTGVEEAKEIPADFSISAYPNPFNSQVAITIKIPMKLLSKNFTFKIYNILGQVVKTFRIDNITSVNKLFWDGKNDDGQYVSSGIYFFKVTSPNFTKSIKLLYLK